MDAAPRDYAGMKILVNPDAELASRAAADLLIEAIDTSASDSRPGRAGAGDRLDAGKGLCPPRRTSPPGLALIS